MPHRPRPPCVVCNHQGSKYTCVSCRADYCSVACYKTHKAETCAPGSTGTPDTSETTSVPLAHGTPTPLLPMSTHKSTHTHASMDPLDPISNPDSAHPDQPLQDPPPLRPLTALKWPYVPDTSAYPDPLTRDDPKPLQTHQYEAVATSPAIRTLLANPHLRTLLSTIDVLRGAEREEALQRALGVDSRLLKNASDVGTALDEDTRTFRAFAEAVEEAVRGGKEDVLGLDWD